MIRTPQNVRLRLARGGSHWAALRRRERDEKVDRRCSCGACPTMGRRGTFAIDGAGVAHALHRCVDASGARVLPPSKRVPAFRLGRPA